MTGVDTVATDPAARTRHGFTAYSGSSVLTYIKGSTGSSAVINQRYCEIRRAVSCTLIQLFSSFRLARSTDLVASIPAVSYRVTANSLYTRFKRWQRLQTMGMF